MRLWVAVATMSQERLEALVDNLGVLCNWGFSLIVHTNGVDVEVSSLGARPSEIYLSTSEQNIGVTPAYQKMYELFLRNSSEGDIILFVHDDVEFDQSGWDKRLMKFFEEKSKCAVAGYGGALGIGDPDIYQTPYKLQQLARRDFISNMRHAEAHGRRVDVPTRVAVLDLFAIAARRSFLEEVGGWSWWPHIHHMLDNGLCLLAHRHGHEVWMLPEKVHHWGGQTSTRVDFLRDFGENESTIHLDGHRTFYEMFRPELPLMIGEKE